MSKPKKLRQVMYPPSFVYFKPQGIPMRRLRQVVVTVDEYEALRLIDGEGFDQAQAAERMNVSRPTSARIIDSARKKIAEAIIEGKAIRIEGGNYFLIRNRLRCRDCGALWEIALDQDSGEEKDDDEALACPNCGSSRIVDLGQQAGWRNEPWPGPGGGPFGGGRRGRCWGKRGPR